MRKGCLKESTRYLLSTMIKVLLLAVVFCSFQVTHIQGDSMYPTLVNDRITLSVRALEIKRDDIVISKYVNNSYIIKRVIAVGGDHIVIDGDNTYINGIDINDKFESIGNVDLVVPNGYVFLLGDNRGNSTDSRTFGAVPIDQIKYKLITTKTVSRGTYTILKILTVYVIMFSLLKSDKKSKEGITWEEQEEVELLEDLLAESEREGQETQEYTE